MYSAKLTLAELKASPPSEGLVLYDNAIWSWASGDFTGQADDVDVVKADSTALTSGAWTRDVTPVVNVLKFIPRSLWPAIRKGTSNVPVASYVAQAYANSSVGAVYFPRGRYLIETEINTNGRKTFGGQFLRPVLIANVVAWPLAFFVMRTWLAGFEDRITLSPLYFAAASALAVVIAVLTVLAQSLRASRSAPAWALRHE